MHSFLETDSSGGESEGHASFTVRSGRFIDALHADGATISGGLNEQHDAARRRVERSSLDAAATPFFPCMADFARQCIQEARSSYVDSHRPNPEVDASRCTGATPTCLDDPDFPIGEPLEEDHWHHSLDEPPDEMLADVDPPEEPEDFVKSSKFDGCRRGMVFKRGSHGLGYYKDQRAVVIELAPALLPARNVTPVVLELDLLVPSILTSRAADTCDRTGDGLTCDIDGIHRNRLDEGPSTAPRGGGRRSRRRPRAAAPAGGGGEEVKDSFFWPNDR